MAVMNDEEALDLLKSMDWNDSIGEVVADGQDALTRGDQEDFAPNESKEEEEDMDKILKDIASLNSEEIAEDIASSKSEEREDSKGGQLALNISPQELREWTKNVEKLDVANVDKEIQSERDKANDKRLQGED